MVNRLNKVEKLEKLGSQSSQEILIIVPAYNEQGNIKKTVEEIFSSPLQLNVLVVNDGSSDRTEKEAMQTKAHLVNHVYNLGIGGAVQTGFKFAQENDFDIVLQVDGDGQHDADYIESLIKPILDGKADMTIGSRFIPPFVGYQSSFIRRIGINFFANLISLITQYRVTDPTSGFRAYNNKMVKIFANYYPQDFPEPEAIVVAGRYNARIQEVPVKMRKRAVGNSSIRYLKTLYYMIKVTVAILLVKWKHKKEF